MYKNVQFWIGDVLRIFEDPSNCPDLSVIKTFSVTGVIVGIRNEISEDIHGEKHTIPNHKEGDVSNRPVSYGKMLGYFVGISVLPWVGG